MIMAEYFPDVFRVFLLILLFENGYCVPIDYCLSPLNTSDCNMAPTPVFSYYKPGSRCEIEFWRGCPTNNSFPNEYLCSHYCIGKLFRTYEVDEAVDKLTENKTVENATEPVLPKDQCMVELNTTKCTEEEIKVYTYQNNSCVEVIWRGCASENKFNDEKSCKDACVKQEKDDVNNWKQKLILLEPEEVKELGNIIDNVIEEENTTVTEGTTQAESTTEPAVTTESQTTEPSTTTEATTTATTEEPTTTSSTESPTTTGTTESPTTTTTAPVTTTTKEAGDAEEVITT